jgi:hypothetical protein
MMRIAQQDVRALDQLDGELVAQVLRGAHFSITDSGSA